MTYLKTTWNDGTAPAINATNLNKIEGGIYDAHELHRDLIAGVTPTLGGWTVAPTDAEHITDGDISTFCTTGNKVAGAWQGGAFEWDLGGFYNVLVTGYGTVGVTAGNPYIFVSLYDGADYQYVSVNDSSSVRPFVVFGGMTSRVLMECKSSASATVTPNIREFHVWRLG